MYQRADGFLQKSFWLYPDLLSYTTLLTICVKVQNINKVDKHGKNTLNSMLALLVRACSRQELPWFLLDSIIFGVRGKEKLGYTKVII